MRLFGRVVVLAFIGMVCGAGGAAAAPILTSPIDNGCALAANPGNCTYYQLNTYRDGLADGTLESELTLFGFHFDEDTDFTVETSSWMADVFDPALLLFDEFGKIVTLADGSPARFFDIDIFGDLNDRIDVQLSAGTYFMALINGYAFSYTGQSGQESLATGYGCDLLDCGSAAAAGSPFSFRVSSGEDVPAPVPEPGTLTLMAGGAIAGLLQRRRTRKRQGCSSSVSR